MAKVKSNISSNKAAARDLQNWTCKQFSEVLSVPWGTGDDFEIKPRPMGQKGVDIIFSPRVKQILEELGIPFSLECKNHKSWGNIQTKVHQAKVNSRQQSDWALVLKRRSKLKSERIEPVIVLDANVFFTLLRGWYAQAKGQTETKDQDPKIPT